ncbi:MAG: rhomboid family intramembrane serine protease [Alphaproteobacteria bacterium]|nr:rhomboid family intramembrane serine protease [Alphaproteobacteria bacterium]
MVVLWGALILLLIHLTHVALPSELAAKLITPFVLYPPDFLPERFAWGMALRELFGHMLLHASLLHLITNMLWLIAFGAPIARRVGAARFFLLFVLGALAGAVAHLAAHWGQELGMIGASGGISALMGGAIRFALRPRLWPEYEPPLMPLTHRRVVTFTLAWVGVNLLFGYAAINPDQAAEGIAWEAHLGGYFFGLLLFPLFDRRRNTMI